MSTTYTQADMDAEIEAADAIHSRARNRAQDAGDQAGMDAADSAMDAVYLAASNKLAAATKALAAKAGGA